MQKGVLSRQNQDFFCFAPKRCIISGWHQHNVNTLEQAIHSGYFQNNYSCGLPGLVSCVFDPSIEVCVVYSINDIKRQGNKETASICESDDSSALI